MECLPTYIFSPIDICIQVYLADILSAQIMRLADCMFVLPNSTKLLFKALLLDGMPANQRSLALPQF